MKPILPKIQILHSDNITELLERNSSVDTILKSENDRQSIIRANSNDRRSNALLHYSVALNCSDLKSLVKLLLAD